MSNKTLTVDEVENLMKQVCQRHNGVHYIRSYVGYVMDSDVVIEMSVNQITPKFFIDLINAFDLTDWQIVPSKWRKDAVDILFKGIEHRIKKDVLGNLV